VPDGNSNVTVPHFSGPVFVHTWFGSRPLRVPGAAHIFAVYVPGGAYTVWSHVKPAPQVDFVV
jgi:hypothetical protein